MDQGQQYPQEPKGSKSIISLTFVAIIIGGLFVLQYLLENKQNDRLAGLIQDNNNRIYALENNIYIKSPGQNEEITRVIDTSGWQVYKNDQLGFSVRIPQEIKPKQDEEMVLFCADGGEKDISEFYGFGCLIMGITDEDEINESVVWALDSPFILGDDKVPPLRIAGIETKTGVYSELGGGFTMITFPYQDLNYIIMYPKTYSEEMMEKVFESVVLFPPDRTKHLSGQRASQRVLNIRQFQTALELRFVDQNNYPYCVDNNNCQPEANEIGVDIVRVSQSGFNGTGSVYMNTVAKDPSTQDGQSPNVNCAASPVAGCNAAYKQLSKDSYAIDFYLEADVGGIKEGSNCATKDGIKAGKCS